MSDNFIKFIDKPITSAYSYIRVSTQKQATEEKHSLSFQKNICESYINTFYPKTDKYIYDDVGSSYNDKNVLYYLNKMIKHMNDNSIIVITDISRLGRNIKQVFNILRKVEKKKSYIISINDSLCYNHTKIMNKQFLHKIIDSEYSSDLKSEKIKKSINYIRHNGGHIGKPPYGYKVTKNAKNIPILIENEDEIQIIDHIIELSQNNNSYQEISDILEKEDIMCKNNYWTKKSIKHILDKFYPEHLLANFSEKIQNIIVSPV